MERQIPDLSRSALQLLVTFFVHGQKIIVMPRKEVMETAGIKSDNRFYAARKELIDGGWLEKVEAEYVLPFMSPATVPLRSGNGLIDRLIDNNSSSSIYLSVSPSGEPGTSADGSLGPHGERAEGVDEGSGGTPTIGGQHQLLDYNPNYCTTTPTIVPVPQLLDQLDELLRLVRDPSRSLSDRCLDADGLDNSGSQHSTTSNYYVRRRVQLALMGEIWKLTFPQASELPEGAAKRFLVFCDDSVELFKDNLEEIVGKAKNISNPQKYIHIALENRKKEASQPAKPVSPAKPRPAPKQDPKADEVQQDEMYRPSEEELKEMKSYASKHAALFPDFGEEED